MASRSTMTDSATRPTGARGPSSPEDFIARLRAQGARYHHLHPFHRRMDAGELTREELQRWKQEMETVRGKLRMVSFTNERALKKVGASLYDAGAQTPQASTTARVHQGLVERSNVESVLEISHMIEVMRAYAMSSDLTKSGEDLLKQAIEKLGTVPNG